MHGNTTARLLCGAAFGAALLSQAAHAASFTIVNGQTVTTTQTLSGYGDIGLVEQGGTISTTGVDGVDSTGDYNTITNSGIITTTGGFAYGILSFGTYAAITNSGSITTTGNDADGIFSTGPDAAITNSGSITTSGEYANGIVSFGPDAAITNSGSITTSGEYAFGIYSFGPDAAITNSGSIIATGSGSYAIAAYGSHATLNLLAGSAIQGRIRFLVPASATLNIGTGLNTALTFDGIPTTINTSGQPYVLKGSTLAVVDPTGFAATNGFAFDLTRSIADTVGARMAPFDADGMATGAVPGEAAGSGRGYWIAGLGFYGQRKASYGFDEYRYGGGGMMIGLDRQLSTTTTAGVFGGFAAGRMRTGADTTSIDTAGGFAGAYWGRDDGRTFTRLSFTAGGMENGSDRTVANNNATGGLETASANYGSFYASPALAVGLHRKLGTATVSPSLGLRYAALYTPGYSESGSAADLSVSGRTSQALDVRGQVETTLGTRVGDKGVSRFDLRAGVDGIFTWGDTVEATLLGAPVSFSTAEKQSVARGFAGADTTFTATGGIVLTAGVEAGYDTADTFTLTAGASAHHMF